MSNDTGGTKFYRIEARQAPAGGAVAVIVATTEEARARIAEFKAEGFAFIAVLDPIGRIIDETSL